MKKLNINKRRLLRLGWPFLVLVLLALIILRERIGINLEALTKSEQELFAARLYEVSDESFSNELEQEIECLVLGNSKEAQSELTWEQMAQVLHDMRVGYDYVDLAQDEVPDITDYKKIVLTICDLEILGDKVLAICDWVYEGGQLLSTGTFVSGPLCEVLGIKAGIMNTSGIQYGTITGMHIADDFMINGNGREFLFSEISDTALNVSLMPDCEVFITDTENGIPLLWQRKFGEGKFVINNQLLYSKVMRGILSTSYSLLGDSFVYPVINASAFYIDDFPSPVPTGDSKFISEDYGVSISTFYTNVWWPDMLALKEKHNLLYSGYIIVDYSDQVEGPFLKNESTERYSFFGNMLLNSGGELGFHGYNHMPLCLENYNYIHLFDTYKYWPSKEKMGEAVRTVYEFSSELFPDARFSVYVPPSNIISEEGIEVLRENWPELLAIASTYHEGDAAYTQEFRVRADGLVETPRIASGCIFEEYMMIGAFSELNFHYVQTYFIHPDDVLDEDRGAELGWATMYDNLMNYADYIYTAAPVIRNVSATGMGEAVREFDKLSVNRVEKEDALYIQLGGFYKEAYLMLRMNEGTPGAVTGGDLEHLTGDLYLVHATDDEIRIIKNTK